MSHRKLTGILLLLICIQTKFKVEGRGFNGGKDSNNEKDLKEIEKRLEEGVGAIKKAEVQYFFNKYFYWKFLTPMFKELLIILIFIFRNK